MGSDLLVMCDGVNSPKFDSWFRFVAECRVEHLLLWPAASPMFLHTLPQFVCHLSWLVRLEFRKCCFSLGTTIRWPCLNFLSMPLAELSDHILEEIVRGSPVLESLKLHFCKGVRKIRIDSRSVKKLILVCPSTCDVETIWAPYLLSLWISGVFPYDSTFRLDDVSSLVEANLYFLMFRGERMLDLLKGLLGKLREVPTIATSGRCFQILLPWEMEGVPFPSSKCQNLTLHVPVTHWNLPWIARLLQSSPCLENLLICLDGWTQFPLDGEDYLCSRNGKFECLGKNLKRVEIIGYEADRLWSNHLLALIEFLLGKALVLEKLINKAQLTRHVQNHLLATDLSKLYGMNRNVLSCRRASQNAEVVFVYRFNRVSR